MTAVSDSSPLVILAKLGCFDLLNRLFPHLYISEEVHHEVVVSGVGLAGASEVANAEWIEVKKLQDQGNLSTAREKRSLGDGELSTILLAKEIQADVVLLEGKPCAKTGREYRPNLRLERVE